MTIREESNATTGWWITLLGSWLFLSALSTLQIVLSMQAVNAPWHPGFLLGMRAFDMVMLAPCILVLGLIRSKLRPGDAGLGWVRPLAIALMSLAIVLTVMSIVSVWLEPVVSPKSEFKGSRIAKAMADYVILGASLFAATLYDVQRELRNRQSHALQLEVQLTEARLRALSAQLHPHFLFNTLNAIAVLVHRDPDSADTMLTRLADLLRATLREHPQSEIALGDEMALLSRYIDIMRIRYGPRLTIDVSMPDDVSRLLVPPFLIQPLVENALEHGVAHRPGPASVGISVARDNGRLRLEVTDDGVGLADDELREGIGLSNTRERLEQLYGREQQLILEKLPHGGTRAVVEFPARVASANTTPLEYAWS